MPQNRSGRPGWFTLKFGQFGKFEIKNTPQSTVKLHLVLTWLKVDKPYKKFLSRVGVIST